MIEKLNKINVGDDIRTIRVTNNEKAVDLCKAIGCNQTDLSLIEHNKLRPNIGFIDRFSEHYNLNEKTRVGLKVLAYSDILSNVLEIEQERVYLALRDFINKAKAA